ncbi:hypothetical protein BU15DRAFT_62795 [Melanogaster broomeanus]|nr:hypothetical protein BU15DRAFT_62795 [Melanogaster broomeanus]
MHEWNGCTANSSTRVPEGIVEDPGGRTPDSPPGMPLEGERGHQSSSGYADNGTIARVHQAQLEAQQGYLEAKETRQDKAAAKSPRDWIHMPHDANDGGGTHRGPRHAQCEGEQSQSSGRTTECPYSNAATGSESNALGGCRIGRSSCGTDKWCTQAKPVERGRGSQSNAEGSGRDGRASGDDGAMSNAGCESRGLAPKMLAEDEPNDSRHDLQESIEHPRTGDKHPRRSDQDHTRPIGPIGCIGYAPEIPGSIPDYPGSKSKDSERNIRRPRVPIARKCATHRDLPYRVTTRTQHFEPCRMQSSWTQDIHLFSGLPIF